METADTFTDSAENLTRDNWRNCIKASSTKILDWKNFFSSVQFLGGGPKPKTPDIKIREFEVESRKPGKSGTLISESIISKKATFSDPELFGRSLKKFGGKVVQVTFKVLVPGLKDKNEVFCYLDQVILPLSMVLVG